MFRLPIYGFASVVCDNKDVCNNTITPESVLKNNYHYIAYHRCSKAVVPDTIGFAQQVTENNIAGLFAKIITASIRRFLPE